MYEQSRLMANFHIRGFQFWDGALALGAMQVGDVLQMRAEEENPYDADAVALYRDAVKLGYIPAEQNALIAQLMHFGHANVVEARVLQVDAQADPWNQVCVGLYMTDAR